MPSTKGLMSLPPELRLRIYDYALDPLTDSGFYPVFVMRKGHTFGACCAITAKHSTRRCCCARFPIAMGLLRVSKQIFTEAMPVLCNHFELRVQIPHSDGVADPKELTKILKTIPEYTYPHMRQLLLTGRNGRPHFQDAYGTQDGWYKLATIDTYWKILESQMPNLRKIRIHLDIQTQELKNFKLRLWAFKGVRKLSKLQLLKLEMHQAQAISEPSWTKSFMEQMQAAILWKMMQVLEGNFEIDLQLLERKRWVPGMVDWL